MSQLDQIAARATDSIHIAVANRAPATNVPRLISLRRRGIALRFAMGAAALVGVIGIAGIVQLEDRGGDPTNGSSTTTAAVTTTAAPVVENPGPVIPIPEGPGGTTPPATVPPVPVTEPPVTTTTSTIPPDTTPPPLTITSPANGAVVEKKAVTFKGTTEPGATVFSGQWEATVDRNGKWSLVLIVSEGNNRARFTATDAAGNQTSKLIEVFYEGEPPPKEKAPLVAHAKYGSCEFDPPYDEYYGTAEPGVTITVTSEYGSGQTVVQENGEWWVKVFFPEAPYGKEFVVTVKDGLGGKKYFEFTSFAGDK